MKRVGGLSRTSKMPWFSYSLPALTTCPGVRARLTELGDNSVCSQCYAQKGRYRFQKDRQMKRLNILASGLADGSWENNMVEILKKEAKKRKAPKFRWHDSGDVISSHHLEAIINIAERVPEVIFWLPSQSVRLMEEHLPEGVLPDNLQVRITHPKIHEGTPDWDAWLRNYPKLQRMYENGEIGLLFVGQHKGTCPAVENKSSCKAENCFKCWQVDKHPIMSYKLH